MGLRDLLEPGVVRRVMLVERFYYRPEHAVSGLARELGVDRNTVLADVRALAGLLGPHVARLERRRGTVELAFAPSSSLLELDQRVYRESNLLALCGAYLERTVDIAAFARRVGLSLSAAYAVRHRVEALAATMGGRLEHGRLVMDELGYRFLAILVRNALGTMPPVLAAHLPSVNRALAAVERGLPVPLTDLDRSFLRTGMGLALERRDHALDPAFLEAVADIPGQDLFAGLDIDGRAFAPQEVRLLALMTACVTARNRVAPDDALASWIERDPEYVRLAAALGSVVPGHAAGHPLFRAAARRLFLFLRYRIAATAFTQGRPVPTAHQALLGRVRDAVAAWAAAAPGTPYQLNDDLLSQFTLQVLPLADAQRPRRARCAVVTVSEVNRLTFATALERALPQPAEVLERAFPSIAEAEEALAALEDTGAGAEVRPLVIVDREYPARSDDAPARFPHIPTAVAEAGSELVERVLEAARG